MTRINLVPVQNLCDQHLLAELRELPRIPNAVEKGRYSLLNVPTEYVLGKGHVTFFYDNFKTIDGKYPVVGSWIIDGEPAGMGICESDTMITNNLSRFIPHVIE